MYGGSAHSGYHTGGHRPEYSPVLSAYHGAQDGRPNLRRDLLPDARVPAAALTPEQTEEFRAALGHLSLRDFHEIYQMMHSEVPTAIANYAPLGTLGGTMGGALDMSMPNSGNFLRPIPDAIKQDQDPRSMSIIQLIESGTLTPGELMVLCDVMHNEQIQKMMETLNPAELAARGNFTINNYAIEKLQQRLFPDNPFALSDKEQEEEQKRLEDFAAACEDMNRTEAQKAWDEQPFHDFAGQRWTSKELLDFFKWTDDPNNLDMVDEDLLNSGNWPPSKIKSAREKAEELKRLERKKRDGKLTEEEQRRYEELQRDAEVRAYNRVAAKMYHNANERSQKFGIVAVEKPETKNKDKLEIFDEYRKHTKTVCGAKTPSRSPLASSADATPPTKTAGDTADVKGKATGEEVKAPDKTNHIAVQKTGVSTSPTPPPAISAKADALGF